MNVLVIDTLSAGLSFAWRCAMAGHSVRWYTKEPDVGAGFKGVEKITNWVGSVMWADLVFSTTSEHADRLDFFRSKGAAIFAATANSVKLRKKEDRSIRFDNLSAAEEFAISYEKPLCVRSGDLYYESTSAADILNWMNSHELVDEVVFTPNRSAPCITVSRFMGSEGWVGPWCESICSSSGCIASFTQESPLCNETLGKIEGELRSAGHLGVASIDCSVVDGVQQESLTIDPQWPLFNLTLGAVKGDPAKWMLDAVNGVDSVRFSESTGVCVQPRPSGRGAPVYGVTRGNRKHLHPQDIKTSMLFDMDGQKVVSRPLWSVVGDRGFTVTGYGKDVKQASERAKKTVRQLRVQGSSFNEHFGDELAAFLPTYHERGYVSGLQYESKVKQ